MRALADESENTKQKKNIVKWKISYKAKKNNCKPEKLLDISRLFRRKPRI
jgi:hypothetical protein